MKELGKVTRKAGVMMIALLTPVILIVVIICVPFVAVSQAVSHPVQTVVDFGGGLIDIGHDFLFGSGDATTEDMYAFYRRMINDTMDELSDSILYQTAIEEVLNQYSETSTVTNRNLLFPFLVTQCEEINVENLTIVANYLSTYMPDNIDANTFTSFVLTTDPFVSSFANHDLTETDLTTLMTIMYDETYQYIPNYNGTTGENIANYALSRLGCRYYWGAEGPDYFDCSGLVCWAYNQAGVSVQRLGATAYSQMGIRLSYGDLMPGDCVYFDWDRNGSIEHVGIYIGNQEVVHASGDGSGTVGQYPDQCVKISSIAPGTYYYRSIHSMNRFY